MISIVLAGPPRGKERVVPGFAGGHAYTSEKTVTFEGRLAYAAQQVMGDRPPLDGALAVAMKFYFPVPPSWPKKRRAAALSGAQRPTVKPDIDNAAKMIDGLNLIVWIDDRQIVEATLHKFYSDRPRTEITVWPVAAPMELFE